MYSTSERLEQFLVNRIILELVPGGFSYLINKLEQLESKLEKLLESKLE